MATPRLGCATSQSWVNYPPNQPCFYGTYAFVMVARRMSNHTIDLPDDPAILKAMIATLQAENAKIPATLRVHDQLVQALRLRIAKLQKLAFGKSSEKIEREIPLGTLLPNALPGRGTVGTGARRSVSRCSRRG